MKDLKEALFENTLWEFKKLVHAKELYGEDHDMTDIPRARFNVCWGIVESAGLEEEYQEWKILKECKPKRWTSLLPENISRRLGNCASRKSDILPLAQAKWAIMKEKAVYEKEDALVAVLELLDCNSCSFDLTTKEYNDILDSIV